jgi:predicted nucleic acid-binding protein
MAVILSKTAYLDTNVVCYMGNDNLPAESPALDELMDLAGEGVVRLTTSELSQQEMARCSKQERVRLPRRVFNLLEKGPFIPDHTVLGFANQEGPMGTVCSNPMVADDPISRQLRQIGLDRMDAHHLMLAIRNGCDFFVTCDRASILKYRDAIKGQFPAIQLMKPSELVQELRSGKSTRARQEDRCAGA